MNDCYLIMLAWFILVAEKWKVICLLIVTIFSVVIQCRYEVRRFDRLIPPSACRSASCPPARNYNMRGLLCSYSCPDAERYVCVENGEGNEVTEFCAPSLECEAGYMGVFTIDSNDPTKIVMTVEPCPPDSYQRYSSNCIHACTSKRDDFTFLTDQFVIYSYGSTVQAPEVYCNYILGFYSPDNITLFDFDDAFQFYFGGYCEHVSEKDPCEKGLMPLPNGTCVRPCIEGQVSDDHDFFICKPQANETVVGSVVITHTTSGTKVTERKREQTTGNSHQSKSDIFVWVITVSVLGVILLILVGIILACFCMKKRWKSKENDKAPNGDIEEQMQMEDLNPKEADETDDIDDIKETESLLEKVEELPQENGIRTHNIARDDLEKYVEEIPEPEKKEHHPKSRSKEVVKNIKRNGTTENNYNATTQNIYILNTVQPEADDVTLRKKVSENVAAGGKAGELKKPHNDTLTQTRWNALNTQPESVGCLISDGDLAGTVFRVGTSYAMTAFHVIRRIIIKDTYGPYEEENFDWARLTCDRVYVSFNESVTDKPKIVSKVSCIYRNATLDVAVLQFNLISDLPRKMVLDGSGYLHPEKVHIIGYGHPENDNKKHIDPSCEVIPANSVKIQEAHAWLHGNGDYYRRKVQNPDLVNAGYHGYDDAHKIILSCYLEHGASGAPLLTVDNKRCVVVVGLLTNGMPEFYFHLSPEDKSAFPTKYRFEYGTRMKDIYNAIRENNPELADDIFGEQ